VVLEAADRIYGCYISYPPAYADASEEMLRQGTEKGDEFSSYVWGDTGISHRLYRLRNNTYGADLKLILLEFYVLPLIEQLKHFRDLGRYRPKEQAIGVRIIVHDTNFFSCSDYDRREFLKTTILERLGLIARMAKRNRLDADMPLLIRDTERALF